MIFLESLLKDGSVVSPADTRRFVYYLSLALYFVQKNILCDEVNFFPGLNFVEDLSIDFKMAERPEDLNLPSAVVSRIIKDALPPQVRIPP